MKIALLGLLIVVAHSTASAAYGQSQHRQEYDRLTAGIAAIDEELKTLQTQIPAAAADQREALVAAFRDKLKQRESQLNQLFEVTFKAYAASPNRDETINRTMIGIVQTHIQNDRYADALKYARKMIEKKFPDQRVLELAGIAEFQSNHFDKAEELLKAAQQAGAQSARGQQFLQMIPDYKKYWQEELKAREADKKSDRLPRIRLETTAGNITLELFENQAPNTVANFVHLVEQGFYDGLTFHRVIGSFMAQGGDPTGMGAGGPGWAIRCECYRSDFRRHFAGTLSMAHAGRDTGGSQFFITFAPTPHLDGRHTAFGRVIDGEENLANIVRRDPGDRIEPTRIIKATVIAKRSYDYVPEKLPPRQ